MKCLLDCKHLRTVNEQGLPGGSCRRGEEPLYDSMRYVSRVRTTKPTQQSFSHFPTTLSVTFGSHQARPHARPHSFRYGTNAYVASSGRREIFFPLQFFPGVGFHSRNFCSRFSLLITAFRPSPQHQRQKEREIGKGQRGRQSE